MPSNSTQLDVACHLNIFVGDLDSPRVERSLACIADLGYRRVVLPPFDPETTDLNALKLLLARYGLLPIILTGQTPAADVGSTDAVVRAAGKDMLLRAVDAAERLGADQVNGVPYGLLGHAATALPTERFEAIARVVGEVADHAHDAGIRLTFEVLNRYETNVVNTATQAMRFIECSGSDNLWVHLDTFHMLIEESDVREAVRIALPKLGYLELGQSGRGALTRGAVDLTEVVRDALDDGYTGRWGIEAFTRPVLPGGVADMLAIWRDVFDDGAELARQAHQVLENGRVQARATSHTTPLSINDAAEKES